VYEIDRDAPAAIPQYPFVAVSSLVIRGKKRKKREKKKETKKKKKKNRGKEHDIRICMFV